MNTDLKEQVDEDTCTEHNVYLCEECFDFSTEGNRLSNTWFTLEFFWNRLLCVVGLHFWIDGEGRYRGTIFCPYCDKKHEEA